MGDILGSTADTNEYRKMKKTAGHVGQGHGDIIKWSAPQHDERVRYDEIEETCLSQRRHYGAPSNQARDTLAHQPDRQRMGYASSSRGRNWDDAPYRGLR